MAASSKSPMALETRLGGQVRRVLDIIGSERQDCKKVVSKCALPMPCNN